MKKINRDGIRALIMETLDELSLGEVKKKVKEQEGGPEGPAVDPEDETAAAGRGSRDQMPQPEDFGEPALSLSDEDVENFTSAVEAYNSNDKMSKAGAAVHLKPLGEKIKAIVKAAEDKAKNKPSP